MKKDSVDLSNGQDNYLFKEDLSKNTLYSNQWKGIEEAMLQ